jgi:hypothetical protein
MDCTTILTDLPGTVISGWGYRRKTAAAVAAKFHTRSPDIKPTDGVHFS